VPDALQRARVGESWVTAEDMVVADDDGVLFVPVARFAELSDMAEGIARTERGQADGMRAGRSIREQLDFRAYLERAATDPSYDFRRHLRERGGAIET
jgi:regulator of RNase E activity RraA